MKKIFIAMAALAALVFTSCDKKETVVIRLDENKLELVKGATRQLNATIIPADENAAFEWFSSNPEYVSVSETGLVKAEKLYYKNPTDTEVTPVTIYCKYNGGAAECKVTVTPKAVKSIGLEGIDTDANEYIILNPGEVRTLKVTFEPEDADVDFSRLEWKTDDFEYVSIAPESDTDSAVITARLAGSARITATYSSYEVGVDVFVSASSSN